MEPKININMDFRNDLKQIISSYLKNNFSDFKLDENLENPFYQCLYPFLNLQKKKITPKKRTVHFSKEFSCPKELKSGLEMLIKKFENGEDVMPYLSKKALSPFKPDDLLYDWGIYHFHLGKMNPKTGRVNRTGPLLFAKIDSKNVYCINTYPHQDEEGITPWCKRDLLRIIENNWPQIIAYGKMEGIRPHFSDDPDIQAEAMTQLDDNGYAELREAGITSPIVLNEESDSVYLFPNEGFTGSGHSRELILKCQRIYNHLRWCEITIKNNVSGLIKEIQDLTGINMESSLHFKLIRIEGQWGYLETHSKVWWSLFIPFLDQGIKCLD